MSLPDRETLDAIKDKIRPVETRMAKVEDRLKILEDRFAAPFANARFMDPRLLILLVWFSGGVYLLSKRKADRVAIS